MNLLDLYRFTTFLGVPLLKAHLLLRGYKGKEDTKRIKERYGIPSRLRPEGKLIWFHAASIGEALSLLKLIEALHSHAAEVNILVTTGTITSANLLAEKLPDYAMHQYVPLDMPRWIGRFLDYWKPGLAIFTESELWPNMILEAQKRNIKLALINARMSERSFTHWQMLPAMIQRLLSPFALIAAQSREAAKHYSELGGGNVRLLGNLKHDAEPLIADDDVLTQMRQQTTGRPCIVAASFHPGEEEIILAVHEKLRKTYPGLFTIIIPRHPNRGYFMAETAKAHGLSVVIRSLHREVLEQTEIYIADTIGELGIWYRLATIVVMGGSFIKHGGQNPLEPARLGATIIVGPHMYHFQEIVDEMNAQQALISLENTDAESLSYVLNDLLQNPDKRHKLAENAKTWLDHKPKVASHVAGELLKLMEGL